MCRQQRFRAGPGKFNIRLRPLAQKHSSSNAPLRAEAGHAGSETLFGEDREPAHQMTDIVLFGDGMFGEGHHMRVATTERPFVPCITYKHPKVWQFRRRPATSHSSKPGTE